MKKTISRILIVFFSLIILLTAATVNVSAANNDFSSKKGQVFAYLTSMLGFNNAAACGIMANIEQESDFDPTLVIRDSNGLLSGGLCQWNGGRFSNLMQYCAANGLNYLSIPGQLSYLKYELQKQGFTHIYKYLHSVKNTAEGAYNAAYYWCYYFEIPSNRAVRAASRGDIAVGKYWPVYQSQSVQIDKVSASSAQNGKTLGFSDAVTIQWKKISNVTHYTIRVAKKANGTFNWKRATVQTVTADKSQVTIPLKDYKVGNYAVRVAGKNALIEKTGKSANTLRFTLQCKAHDYVLETAKEPTFRSAGQYVYVCKLCGAKKTVSKPMLTTTAFGTQQVSGLSMTALSTNAVTLQWDRFAGAAGYCVYQEANGKWTRLKTLRGADTTACTIRHLTPATCYVFKVCATATDGKKTYTTADAIKTVITRPKAVKLKTLKAAEGILRLTWTKSDNVDGYTVYVSDAAHPGTYKAVADVDATKTAYAFKDGKVGVSYTFQVKPYVLTKANKRIHADASNTLTCVAK